MEKKAGRQNNIDKGRDYCYRLRLISKTLGNSFVRKELSMRKNLVRFLPVSISCLFLLAVTGIAVHASSGPTSGAVAFPPSLSSYHDGNLTGIVAILKNRIHQNPFNLAASIIFLCAIIHTFLTSKFLAIAHCWETQHQEMIRQGKVGKNTVHIGAGIFEFLGEVEAIFGIWAIVLGMAVISFYDWNTLVGYLSHEVDFAEPMFVVTIMILASTRPILNLAEACMRWLANLMGGSLAAWWFILLTAGPVMSSFITEPAAMTITALLLSRKLYELNPSNSFKYATIGLLFVNISIGGTFTHFAAPPVLMVAAPWKWGTMHMLSHFGWKALVSMLISNGIYFLVFRRELRKLQEKYVIKSIKDELQKEFLSHSKLDEEIDHILQDSNYDASVIDSLREQIEVKIAEIRKGLADRLKEKYLQEITDRNIDVNLVKEAFYERFEEIKILRMRRSFPRLLPEEQRPVYHDPQWDKRDDPVPAWVILVHVAFMLWTIINAHHPALFIAGLLFFIGFARVTTPYQNTLDLKPPLMVGFFLSGLVIHGGLQAWWIAPVLSSLNKVSLMLAATVLTAFNDNAAITFLATLVPHLTDPMKHAVVAGAVTGGGLTVIANAPNPAGQSLLKKYFDHGVSPVGLLKAALLPTVIVWVVFYLFL